MMVASTNLVRSDTTVVGSGIVIRIATLIEITVIPTGVDTGRKGITASIMRTTSSISSDIVIRFMQLVRQ